MSNEKPKPPIQVPLEALSPGALENLIEEFILREGTDYGSIEVDHAKKILQIRKQLENARIKITFDPNTETVTLMTETDWKKSTGNVSS